MPKLKKSLLFLLFNLINFLIVLVFCFSLPVVANEDIGQWQHHKMRGEPALRGSAILGDSMWVSGSKNAVFVSQDGGKTWQDKSVKSPISTGFRDIALFDSQTAIVMGIGNGESSMLYKTKDGGDSWHLLYQNEDEQGFFDSIAFWDKNKGLLMGDPVDGFYVIKKTIDGGKTWRRIARDKLPTLLEKEAAFAASGNTMIVGKNGNAYITTGGFSSSVYISNDYGETWQRQAVPLYQATQYAGGYALAINDLNQLFVLGGDFEQRAMPYANMAMFIDGKWQKVDAGKNGLRTAMSCQKAICIATGKTSSDISFDSGKSWQVLNNVMAKKGEKGFFTLASDKGMFLAAGINGKVGVLALKKK